MTESTEVSAKELLEQICHMFPNNDFCFVEEEDGLVAVIATKRTLSGINKKIVQPEEFDIKILKRGKRFLGCLMDPDAIGSLMLDVEDMCLPAKDIRIIINQRGRPLLQKRVIRFNDKEGKERVFESMMSLIRYAVGAHDILGGKVCQKEAGFDYRASNISVETPERQVTIMDLLSKTLPMEKQIIEILKTGGYWHPREIAKKLKRPSSSIIEYLRKLKALELIAYRASGEIIWLTDTNRGFVTMVEETNADFSSPVRKAKPTNKKSEEDKPPKHKGTSVPDPSAGVVMTMSLEDLQDFATKVLQKQPQLIALL